MWTNEDWLRKTKCQEVLEQYEKDRRKKEEEAAEASRGITESEGELKERINKTRRATRALLSLLPTKLDKADLRRLARASKSADDDYDNDSKLKF